MDQSSSRSSPRGIAACLIRDQPHYRQEAFRSGLARFGYQVEDRPAHRPTSSDLLVIWNRYGHYEHFARRYEAAGAAVLVVENGWISGQGKQYAICRSNHNGAGTWTVGDDRRWNDLNVDLWPWREDGQDILVLPQRGIGPDGVAMPLAWPHTIVSRLREVTDRSIRVRPHPGKERPPLEPDLDNCWAVVTWGSGAGIKAIAAGVPVFHEMPNWIGAPAARFGIEHIEQPFLGDRLPMFSRLAWAQWSVDEISSGEAFEWLLGSQSTISACTTGARR